MAPTINTELVAKTVAGIAQIGEAQHALQQAGWSTQISANKISIEDAFEAHLLSSNGHGWWQVFACDGSQPVWTVGAQCEASTSWAGCED
jgi:hypothetical protein